MELCRLVDVVSTFAGSFDSSVHISEEATNAGTAVPFAIVASAAVGGLVGWGEFVHSCQFELDR